MVVLVRPQPRGPRLTRCAAQASLGTGCEHQAAAGVDAWLMRSWRAPRAEYADTSLPFYEGKRWLYRWRYRVRAEPEESGGGASLERLCGWFCDVILPLGVAGAEGIPEGERRVGSELLLAVVLYGAAAAVLRWACRWIAALRQWWRRHALSASRGEDVSYVMKLCACFDQVVLVGISRVELGAWPGCS